MTRQFFLASLAIASVLCSLPFTAHAMVFKSDNVQAQWDTWAYEHEGTFYLYYLITEHGPGEGFGVATSTDGVHWTDHGWAIRQSDKNSFYLGTGSVWKSPDFDKTGRFICNYSEHRKDEQGRNIQNILFAWSTDLIHWNKYDDSTIFKIDPEHYSPTGRWDCIFAIPRAEGGYWGTWTATGRNIQGTVGIGYAEDGLNWKALPPPVVEPGVSESGAFYEIDGRIYAMFGRGGMWSYVADRVTGPYRVSPKNPSLITRPHTYFSRFLPTHDGLLVNHHSMSGTTLQSPSSGRQREVTYVAPFKRAKVDDAGILRWKYWEGNDALKGKSVATRRLDFNTGIVMEADVTLPVEGDKPVVMIFVAGPTSYAVRILPRGVVQMGTVDSAGANWQKRYEVDREWQFGTTAELRILARAGMMEIYLDDQFMQCWTMGCHGEPEVKLGIAPFSGAESSIRNVQLWQMSLEAAKAPPIQHPLKATATASSTYGDRYGAQCAVDSRHDTRWCSSQPYGKQDWLQVDLGAVHEIDRVEILWEVAFAKGYRLSISNDADDWDVIYETSNGDGGRDRLDDLKASVRYLRLDCLERGTEHGFSIHAFSVFGKAVSSTDVAEDGGTAVRVDTTPKQKISYRPQYHFSAEEGYINDPNGLFYYDGVYHMFFQHWDMGRKAWGHATSKDVLHWTEHGDALKPHDGFQAFSGSAVVDIKNTSGLQDGPHPPIVALYTAWGDGQHLAFSNDGGWTWKRYGRVLALPSDEKKSFPLSARDPLVIWHQPTERWVMVLYQNFDQSPSGKAFGYYTSPNLKDWTFESRLPGFYVCPDLFELPVEGEPETRKWILLDWDRDDCKYAIGHFDGHRFQTEIGPLNLVHGKGHHGATQTWKVTDGGQQRLLQIVNLWHGKFPGEPFENQMSVPLELSLRRTPAGLRLCRKPFAELQSLFRDEQQFEPFALKSDESKSIAVTSRSFTLKSQLSIPKGSELTITILGHPIAVRSDSVTFAGVTGELPGTAIRSLEILADVTSVEVFVNDGELVKLHLVDPPAAAEPIELTAAGSGAVAVESLKIYRVASTLHSSESAQATARVSELRIADFEGDSFGEWSPFQHTPTR